MMNIANAVESRNQTNYQSLANDDRDVIYLNADLPRWKKNPTSNVVEFPWYRINYMNSCPFPCKWKKKLKKKCNESFQESGIYEYVSGIHTHIKHRIE